MAISKRHRTPPPSFKIVPRPNINTSKLSTAIKSSAFPGSSRLSFNNNKENVLPQTPGYVGMSWVNASAGGTPGPLVDGMTVQSPVRGDGTRLLHGFTAVPSSVSCLVHVDAYMLTKKYVRQLKWGKRAPRRNKTLVQTNTSSGNPIRDPQTPAPWLRPVSAFLIKPVSAPVRPSAPTPPSQQQQPPTQYPDVHLSTPKSAKSARTKSSHQIVISKADVQEALGQSNIVPASYVDDLVECTQFLLEKANLVLLGAAIGATVINSVWGLAKDLLGAQSIAPACHCLSTL